MGIETGPRKSIWIFAVSPGTSRKTGFSFVGETWNFSIDQNSLVLESFLGGKLAEGRESFRDRVCSLWKVPPIIQILITNQFQNRLRWPAPSGNRDRLFRSMRAASQICGVHESLPIRCAILSDDFAACCLSIKTVPCAENVSSGKWEKMFDWRRTGYLQEPFIMLYERPNWTPHDVCFVLEQSLSYLLLSHLKTSLERE